MKREWKGSPPRVRSICVVDDSEDKRRQLREFIEALFPKAEVRTHETIFEAYRGWQRFDYLVIDVSSVAPQMLSDVNHAWSAIAKFMSEHPGTEVLVTSAMSRNATQDVIEDVQRAVENPRMIQYGGTGEWESNYPGDGLKEHLTRLIKPVDFEWTKVKSKRKRT